MDRAKEVAQYLKKLQTGNVWEAISKSPISFVHVENEIVLITPGGFYMLDKVKAIEDFLKAEL